METPEHFEDLPEADQSRVRSASAELVRLAHSYSTTVLIAGYATPGAKVNSATGMVVMGEGGPLLLTAWHVVAAYVERRAAESPLFFYVGNAPMTRIDVVFEDQENDVACIRLPQDITRSIETRPYTPMRWPPARPQVGDTVFFAGFPGAFRRSLADDEIEFADYSPIIPVTAVRERYFVCQFDREGWISFGRAEIPPPGTDLGGISGAPVFVMGRLSYPLVGVVSEFSHDFELLYVRTLDHLPSDLVQAAP